MSGVDVKQVQTLSVFDPLSASHLTSLLRRAELRRYTRNDTVFRQGQPADGVWVVREGWVHLVRTPTRGDAAHAVVLFTVTPREVLCGVSAVEGGPYSASGIAGTEAAVMRIPAADFNRSLRQVPEFAYQVLRLYAQRIRQMAEQYGAMAEPVSRRIVRMLLRLHGQFGATIPVTHRELAQMSWTTTESAIRMVRRLKAQGVVSGRRGELTLRHVGTLERLLGEGRDVDGRY
jgi:CRP/FNR family transcriptional regulator